jgi:hypothetical protein
VALAVHLVVSLAHGIPHAAIPVPLTPAQWTFVGVVITLGPIVGFALAWRGRVEVGAALYALAMLGAFAFGVYHHFLIPNPDHTTAVPAGPWRIPFIWTAVLVAISEGAGVVVGIGWLVGRNASERGREYPSADRE